jgi:hypothetical protein
VDTKSPDKADLVRLLHSQDRGLLCYDKCSDVEMKTFTRVRKVSCYLKLNKSAQISKLLRALNVQTFIEADDNAHFERFFDLPSKLGNRIKGYCNKEFPVELY